MRWRVVFSDYHLVVEMASPRAQLQGFPKISLLFGSIKEKKLGRAMG